MLGSGNVATAFARLLHSDGFNIIQVYSRHIQNAQTLALEVNAGYTDKLSDISKAGDVYIIAVADAAIEAIAAELRLPGKTIVHTAGSVAKDVLSAVSETYGVIYPVQSISKRMNRVPPIPLLIDATDGNTLMQLMDLTRRISKQVQVANDEERKKLHLSAVFVSNFTNHLYAIAEEYCRQNRLSFQLLHPLIKETAERLQFGEAAAYQTGPAIRQDYETLSKHMHMLESNPEAASLYELLSKSIIQHTKDRG